MKFQPLDLALGLLVTIIWGSNFSVIELGLEQLDPFLLTALRFTCCALPLVFFMKRPAGVSLTAIAGYGLLFGVGLWWVVNYAMHLGLTPGLASLILQFSAFFTIFLSAWLLKEKIAGPQIAGVILASLGLLSIIHFTEGQAVLTGTVLVLLAALSWSACNLIVKQTRPGDMVAFIVWSSLFAAPPLFLMTWLAKGSAPFYQLGTNLTPAAIFSVLFQAYVTTLFGYRVWNNLMKKYPSSMVAPLSLMVPISGVTTSWLMFDESIGPYKLASIVVILLGIALFINAALIANWLQARAARQVDEPLG
ncbi:EamA family transporter [Pseudomonas gingeri]|uniref:EamA family transporter n=1 Tax=Pseudomonas gingeri TaxID=117681 RepID=A0A7Y7WRD8_9PSED|nr:EamA family transporter [Pseudomonas gingeri]NWB86276.1 EamA family transporter [Pseudomonas gingeri]